MLRAPVLVAEGVTRPPGTVGSSPLTPHAGGHVHVSPRVLSSLRGCHRLLSPQTPAQHVESSVLRPPLLMGDPVSSRGGVGPEELARMERVPAGPSGGSGNKVQRVAASSSVSWERAGCEEATAPGRGHGECSLRGPPRRLPGPAQGQRENDRHQVAGGQRVLSRGPPATTEAARSRRKASDPPSHARGSCRPCVLTVPLSP